MVKILVICTSNIIGSISDTHTSNRIYSLLLSILVSISSGGYKKEEVLEFFERIKNMYKNSTMTSDKIVYNYAEQCISALEKN